MATEEPTLPVQKTPNGALLVSLLCDGKLVEARPASSPEDAADVAIILIKHISELDDGDSLTVAAADPGKSATLVPGVSV